MEFDVEVCRLSSDFYNAYPSSSYPEILQKDSRPYTCLLIDLHYDYFICIPFRSNMGHQNGFAFNGTQRSASTPSGLDYQKLVLIKDTTYIDSATPAVVDQDEYNAMITNLPKIVTDAVKYIDKYIHHVNGSQILHHREYTRCYGYSTLPYFHDILGI